MFRDLKYLIIRLSNDAYQISSVPGYKESLAFVFDVNVIVSTVCRWMSVIVLFNVLYCIWCRSNLKSPELKNAQVPGDAYSENDKKAAEVCCSIGCFGKALGIVECRMDCCSEGCQWGDVSCCVGGLYCLSGVGSFEGRMFGCYWVDCQVAVLVVDSMNDL